MFRTQCCQMCNIAIIVVLFSKDVNTNINEYNSVMSCWNTKLTNKSKQSPQSRNRHQQILQNPNFTWKNGIPYFHKIDTLGYPASRRKYRQNNKMKQAKTIFTFHHYNARFYTWLKIIHVLVICSWAVHHSRE